VNITYDALMKRVSRASVEDIITEIRSTSTSTESVVSSLSSPREQADDSLTSENTAETTSHNDQSLGTPELKSGVGGWTKRSTKAKKKKDKEIESKCTDNAITFEYSRQNRNPGVLRRSDTRNPRGIPRGNLGVARLGTSKRLAGATKKREARE